VVLHLRPSRDQVTSDLLERRALHRRHRLRVDAQVRQSTRQCCRDIKRIRTAALSHWPRRIGSGGDQGTRQGVGGAGRGLRHQGGRCRKVKTEGRKGRERAVGKAVEDECVFLPGEGPGWQIRSVSTCGPLGRMAYFTGTFFTGRNG